MDYHLLLVVAIILLSTKVFGLLSQKVHMPQVVGALAAGLILGPSVLNIVVENDFLTITSEIGVILLMFLAGLDTDIKELKKTGFASFIIAILGVGLPLAGGYFTYQAFFSESMDSTNFLKAIFVGVILTATSVSITVETLREMGKLKGKVGTAILGAAIIDDILGIIILTVIIGMKNPDVSPTSVVIKILLFFVFVVVVGVIMYVLFKKMDKVYEKKRRVAIYGFAFCLILSFVAEHYFGIADITGAYFAGLIICNINKTKNYIAGKLNILSYMMFSPLFFASIGIKTELSGFTQPLLIFSLVLLVVAIFTKIIGCGIGARITGFSTSDSFKIGIGMISRGEVALIVAQKGSSAGLVDTTLFPAIVFVVIVTTLITPILLKFVMKDNSDQSELGMTHPTVEERP